MGLMRLPMFLIMGVLVYYVVLAWAGMPHPHAIAQLNGRSSADPEPCGTVVTEDEKRRTQEALDKFRLHGRRQDDPEYEYEYGPRTHNIDVVFQIVAANLTYEGGWIPDYQIDDQMTMLNKNYEGTGFSFRLVGTNRILSTLFFENVSSDTRGVLSDLTSLFRQGDAMTLNIYTLGLLKPGQGSGFSSQPVNYASSKSTDGIFIKWNSLPGGSSMERQGGTATHEAGHWLGLQHVFEGGCTGIGDGVDDTPPQAVAIYGCPIGSDTCPDDDMPDPIYNFMGYTNEECRSEFTPGQVSRMHLAVEAFRVGRS